MPEDNCALCGLPLRFGTVHHDIAAATYRFCCIGCRQVFVMLMEVADTPDPTTFRDTDLFKQCRLLGIIPTTAADLASGAYGREGIAETPPAGPPLPGHLPPSEENRLLDLNLDIGNMWCPACAWVIEQALAKQAGVVSVTCNFSTDRVRCAYDPVRMSPDRIVGTLEKLGYHAAAPGQDVAAANKRKELVRFCISALLTMNVMMLSFALYSGFFSRLDPEAIGKISWPIFIMASVIFFYGGGAIHKKAWAGIVSAAPGMETLISIGATSAYVYSTINFFAGSIHLYFDTVSMLITLVLVGKMLERKAKDRIQENLGNFFSLQPTKARICTAEIPEGRYVSVNQLQSGDVFSCRDGEIIPADGVVLSGRGRADEASLTGEALPVAKKAGDRLSSGTRVLSGNIKARADGIGESSLLGQMIVIMERALGRKTPIEGKTDRLLKGFVPAILIIGAATGTACLLRGMSLETAVIRTVTVLVIACPCSLGIAIPMARVAGISVAGRNGLVVRDFAAFESAGQVGAFVFDKTGTVTEGRWHLTRVVPFGSLSENRALTLAAGLEQNSDHTVARLIREEAARRKAAPADLQGVSAHENGMSCVFNGHPLRIGSEAFVAENLAEAGSPPAAYRGVDEKTDASYVYMSRGGKLAAVFEFGDTVRDGAATAVRQLDKLGYRMAMVSGDGDATTRKVGARIGVADARGGMLPLDKADFVADIQAKGLRVAMVGDGVNDAPALVQSDLGIAVHSGSHLGKEAADVTLMRGEPQQIIQFLALAEAVNRKIHQNLWCAFVYNIVSIPIAMSGLLTPLVAVCAMLLSSLTVIGNTMRLARYSPAVSSAQRGTEPG